ncbi:PREDICTED: probable helicase MAGATAMA 3 isoform X2 [Nelumbo nucifera]|uniref:Probable helicase MAGATAMA 3 isoform X2 n=1 Tax=Nelumbo nucifera TaxID=4432 RepID=A0A1U8AI33_NELNU|nr:PREDICTED: probable helicase MAGATAMA 3 isoform X2 [Nelumbo nucifera]
MTVETVKHRDDFHHNRFHKIVLSWDYLRLLKESDKNSRENGAALGLNKIKDTYKDVNEYIGTFEPLLFEEVKAQVVQGKDDEEASEWTGCVTRGCSEVDGFLKVKLGYNSDECKAISDNDLVLLSKEQFQEGATLPNTYAFAFVENREGKDHIQVRMFLAGEVKQISVDETEPSARLLSMRTIVKELDKFLWMLKICSLSTILREYAALRSVGSLPFKDLILSAAERDAYPEDRAWKIPRALMEFLESNHNTSQLEAIRAGLSRKTFVLIQGPPGTGKTQTILGLLSAILHATPERVQSKGALHDAKRRPLLPIEEKYRHWNNASPWLTDINPRDKIMPIDGDDGFFPTTGNELKPEVVNSHRKYRVRVLVCAPSNSALDEIVLRLLSTGIRDENDHTYNPKIVRIGLKPHHSVQAVSMDYLVQQKLSGMDHSIADTRKPGARPQDLDNARASVLNEAAIVFSTLSFSGSHLFSKLNHVFDVVIIDEAAQAVEPATLVPLANGCKQVFLVGDPVQLPATVISPTAERFGYGMSLFKRFQRAGYPVQMLKTQYRMHPEIRSFPSREFYNEALEDGPDVKDQTERSWHAYRCFAPFCFFDIEEGIESQPSGSGSWINVDEVEFILLMYHKLVTRFPELKSSSRLAIISPYRHQVKLFRERFHDTFGVESDKLVDINTVDGFQGREKDVAIFSCVRASSDKGIGFLADFRRMNVGITRARSSVLVVGSASTLRRADKHWRNLVESAEQRNCLFKVLKPYKSFFTDENLKSMEVKHQTMLEAMENQLDEIENTGVLFGNPVGVGEGDQGQMDEDDYGDGDDGGFDED